MTSPLHVRLAETLKAMFNCVDCPIHFVTDLKNGARGIFDFATKAVYINTKQSFAMMIETICHELIHFKQHRYNKLKPLGGGRWVYNGKEYVNTPYHEQPWEHEANHYMKLMFSRFASKAPKSLIQEVLDADGTIYA